MLPSRTSVEQSVHLSLCPTSMHHILCTLNAPTQLSTPPTIFWYLYTCQLCSFVSQCASALDPICRYQCSSKSFPASEEDVRSAGGHVQPVPAERWDSGPEPSSSLP